MPVIRAYSSEFPTVCSLVVGYHRARVMTLKTEVTSSYETLVSTYKTAWCQPGKKNTHTQYEHSLPRQLGSHMIDAFVIPAIKEYALLSAFFFVPSDVIIITWKSNVVSFNLTTIPWKSLHIAHIQNNWTVPKNKRRLMALLESRNCF
jgi:hypothetical protein